MKKSIQFPIRYVSRQTGLSTHQIRAWERRYSAVAPERTESNRRMYSKSDIARLKLLIKARGCGHGIAHLAKLSTDDLMRLINADSSDPNSLSPGERKVSATARSHYRALLRSVYDLDSEGLTARLERAAVELTRVELINRVMMPLSVRMLELRQNGSIRLIHEHMATNVMRLFLWDMIRSTKVSALSPKIVVTTPAGQTNELGAMLMALLASESGWRALYFGPDMPAEETAAAAELTKARAVALYVAQQVAPELTRPEISKLRRLLNNNIRILIGGQPDRTIATMVESEEVLLFDDGEGFRKRLESLLASQNMRGQ